MAFRELLEDKERGPKIKGVWFEDSYIRRYPNDSLACHVVGYTVTGNQGQTGIEEEYSSILNGTNGRSYNYLNEDLEQAKSVKAPTDGNSVVSTIDVTLQGIVEKYIDKFIEDYTNKNIEGPAAKNIGVVMMDPQNGEILAMGGDVDFEPGECTGQQLYAGRIFGAGHYTGGDRSVSPPCITRPSGRRRALPGAPRLKAVRNLSKCLES